LDSEADRSWSGLGDQCWGGESDVQFNSSLSLVESESNSLFHHLVYRVELALQATICIEKIRVVRSYMVWKNLYTITTHVRYKKSSWG
jgi:hypothetical protein